MGRRATLLEGICVHAVSLGAQALEVEYQDGQQLVYARRGDTNIRVASYVRYSADEKELREDLYAATKKVVRTVFGDQVYLLQVRGFDSVRADGFEVVIEPAPKLDPSTSPSFTRKQGQHLAFIYHYTKIHHRPPAELDLQQYFGVSPPSIHEMIKTLERNGLIEKTPSQARSIRLLVKAENLPPLE